MYVIIDTTALIAPCQVVEYLPSGKIEKFNTLTAARKACRHGQTVVRVADMIAVCVKRAA